MERVLELVKAFPAYVIALATFITALSTVIKPLRKLLLKLWHKITGIDTITAQIDKVKHTVDDNERDRLKDIIYHYGSIARHRQPITETEFRHLQDVFSKYESLNGNGRAKEEYIYIQEYFNKQN